MFPKISFLAVALLAIGGARAQCPNGGVGVGQSQLCSLGSKDVPSQCYAWTAFITTPSTWNTAAVKVIDGYPDICGLGYSNGARTACDSANNVISVNPPGAGTSICHHQGITIPGSSSLGGGPFPTVATTPELGSAYGLLNIF